VKQGHPASAAREGRLARGFGGVDVFGADAEAYEVGWDAAEVGKIFQERESEGEALHGSLIA